jgi:uncharacterized membrane protein
MAVTLDNVAHVLPAATAVFLAALVEAIEAMTIVLAVGTVRGWRPALIGALTAIGLLVVLVAALGPLLRIIPEHLLQLLIGVLLLLFGLSWLRKAVLRAAGRMVLHDESRAFVAETAELREQERRRVDGLQWLAGVASFKAVFLEGIEVVFIVLALSTTPELMLPSSVAAIAACALVAAAGFYLHRPLSRVPENTLKFSVGVMLAAFGVYWLAEGLGVVWPGGALAVVGLALGWFGVGLLAVVTMRQRSVIPRPGSGTS